ncbi:MAG: cysteine hydrolase [Ardenticatenaceae bacterium]|nr:cysteine hydrolase [Ardenticatenaceae bacterium]
MDTASDIFGKLPRHELVPERSAVLVVDMQYYDAHRAWGIGRDAREQGHAEEYRDYFERLETIVVPNLQRLLDAARRAGSQVIYVRIMAASPDGRDISRQHRDLGILVPPGAREADILDEIAPHEGELVLSKTAGGVFNSTAIDQVLRNLGIDTLIVTGVVTNGCVETAVRDASDRSYKIFVVEDCCAALTEKEHSHAIWLFGKWYANVLSTAELIERLRAERVAITSPA